MRPLVMFRKWNAEHNKNRDDSILINFTSISTRLKYLQEMDVYINDYFKLYAGKLVQLHQRMQQMFNRVTK